MTHKRRLRNEAHVWGENEPHAVITLAEFFQAGKTGSDPFTSGSFKGPAEGWACIIFNTFRLESRLQLYRGRNNTDPQLVYSEINNNNNKSTKAETVKAALRQKS